eukprot:8540476-Lingulodinium_polyedra.AAC.1
MPVSRRHCAGIAPVSRQFQVGGAPFNAGIMPVSRQGQGSITPIARRHRVVMRRSAPVSSRRRVGL